jgi:S-methylmethionine-dependent homocysteine/selenocysteine methylase
MAHYLGPIAVSPAYARIDGVLGNGGSVLLDGGIATELQRVRSEQQARSSEPWGTWALFRGPIEVLEVHRRYILAGCDVISTNTWSVLEAAEESRRRSGGGDSLWLDAARLGIRLARQAIDDAGRGGECAAAFCVNSSLIDERASGRLELLSWMWNEEPPDLVVLETVEEIPDEAALGTIEMVCETGLPVWISFRRGKQGMASVDGRIEPDADPQAFPRALERLREIGVDAVLVNCVPVDGLAETLEWLRPLTPLPVGCYPNLGHSSGARWSFDEEIGPEQYAQLAESWVAAGARIIGGCCGVTPAHVAALRALTGSRAASSAPIENGT